MSYAFIHIPKTAGRAFWTTIHDFTGLTISPNKLMAMYFRHGIGNYQMYGGHTFYQTLKGMLPDYTEFFTLLRDPINRAYSHWQYLKNNRNFHYYGLGPPEPRFGEFIRHPLTRNLASNFQCRYLTVEVEPPKEQQRLLYQIEMEQKEIDLSGKAELAISSLKDFAYVGTQETYAKSVKETCRIMGFDPPVFVSQIRKDYYGEISQADMDFLMEANAEDWTIYNEFK